MRHGNKLRHRNTGKGPRLRHRHGSANTEAPKGKKSGLLLVVLLVAQLMVILDITAVNIALPSLART